MNTTKQNLSALNHLSLNLKNLLINADLSENELARRTGVSQQIINRILSGQNKNPKIATLSPIANYFMLSMSQLLGEASMPSQAPQNPAHWTWREVPLIAWEALNKTPLDALLSSQQKTLWVETPLPQRVFAIILKGHEMDPKFSEGTLLIFDAMKKPAHRDFMLLRAPTGDILVRQLFTKDKKAYQKALNPLCTDYELSPFLAHTSCLGTLIQSRTNHEQL